MREANIVRMVIVPISGRQRISKIKNMRERELMKKLERGSLTKVILIITSIVGVINIIMTIAKRVDMEVALTDPIPFAFALYFWWVGRVQHYVSHVFDDHSC